MTKPLILLLLALPTVLSAQWKQDGTRLTDKTVGKNLVTNQPIRGKEIYFGERIHHTEIDTQQQLMTVQLRGTSANGKWMDNTGDHILYDLKQKRGKWRKNIVYETAFIENFGKYILEIKEDRTHRLNPEDGKPLWSTKNRVYFADPELEIGIGYKFSFWSGGQTDKLEGINLKTGEDIWSRRVGGEYNWNDLLYMDDSTVLIVADGLHTLNLKTGRGWDYNTTTYEYGIRDIVSNVLRDSNDIYLASRNELVKVKKQGKLAWSAPLAHASKSVIFINDGKLYVVNRGYAYRGYRQVDYGKPFVAAFDVTTGKELFKGYFGKGNTIKNFRLIDNAFYLVLEGTVVKISADNGAILAERKLDEKVQGKPAYFIGTQTYVLNNGNYKALTTTDTTKRFVFTDKHKVLALDNQLQVVSETDTADLWVYYAAAGEKKFLSKNDKTIVIDKDDRKIAELDATHRGRIIGTSLYDINNDNFTEIDISSILKD
ncbi:PQQ-binding-like beta-propeller repeat protein [Polluticoccus soli]|uniref:outer membrane protein assembly factor BamB family protein n=1 Tax=Polluticoccus soli TaxID=3034150 RepID=UPI0023E1F9B7|nr:PQQ-binding-like beta-propeller repeat protein [Flavipsychrobacter sp. JY13-12]